MKVRATEKAYEFEMPKEVKAELQRYLGKALNYHEAIQVHTVCFAEVPKGNPMIPVKNFSNEVYDDVMYGSIGMVSVIFTLLTENKITEEQMRSVKVYETVMQKRKVVQRTLCKYQEFADCKIFLNRD